MKESIPAEKENLDPFIEGIREIIASARRAAAASVNALQTRAYFEIGRRIVEREQKGSSRAEYGTELLKALSARLSKEFGRGFSAVNLALMRRFYLEWKDRVPIFQTPSEKSVALPTPFTLSWSHYVVLLTVKDVGERSFYEIEATRENWSLAELKRQISSCLYERLALSRDKAGVARLSQEGQTVTAARDLLKDPYVLEFLDLEESERYSESDLESAITGHLEKFLLELGKGFLFEARQKRLSFDEDHYYVDLVFYNRLLRCYVLIDLKLDKLTHQDLGQMQMYVNYYDRYVKTADENPTVGILLCKRKKDILVELTLPADANVHAREYRLYLPSKETLQNKLSEWVMEREAYYGTNS